MLIHELEARLQDSHPTDDVGSIVQRGIGSGGGLRVPTNSNQILIQRPLKGVKMQKRTCHFRAPPWEYAGAVPAPHAAPLQQDAAHAPSFLQSPARKLAPLSPHTNACTPDAAADSTPWTGPSSAGAKAGKQGSSKVRRICTLGRQGMVS
jgi:hypothetical protein